MGCDASRDLNAEVDIQASEMDLGFVGKNISEIIEAFFNLQRDGEIEEKKIYRALDSLQLSFKYEKKQQFVEPFLEIFQKESLRFSEPGDGQGNDKVYDYQKLMVAIFVMATDSTKNKATAIFTLFDTKCEGFISNEELRTMLQYIILETRDFSEMFSNLTKFKLKAQKARVDEKVNELIETWYNFILVREQTKITEDEFVKKMALLDKENSDILTSKTIRKIVMPYVLENVKDLPNSAPGNPGDARNSHKLNLDTETDEEEVF